MSFYWVKTNAFIKRVFSKYCWDIPNNEKKIYLTFDDGPTPEVTNWVLDELKKYEAKATFFCIGKNINSNPELFLKIKSENHSIGNHTFNHLNGWKSGTDDYIKNVTDCAEILKKEKTTTSLLFRPPYGRIKKEQSKVLRKLGYKIIMWDVLSADFDRNITPEKCLENVVKNVKSGSVIVFHDSIKASQNLKFALPKTLDFLNKKGFVFDVIR
ncbi:polysaccharide deacetylase family protein [Flavobacterium sp. GA093]|uniref:Polysaccharide deacetylase family protein n=1 Tax=Flavobacterium hydrocarbonoxydans TaxID=2683249 RepID=A0A6I4NX94_9FLAO|nr:polysaccharide deacetylase family protein [Flavobacterium hydrocarbonoxydans]MWB95644.1 polysaccharide deacetylase family protein [Flavobacterium hydrocarbonoxydans]